MLVINDTEAAQSLPPSPDFLALLPTTTKVLLHQNEHLTHHQKPDSITNERLKVMF